MPTDQQQQMVGPPQKTGRCRLDIPGQLKKRFFAREFWPTYVGLDAGYRTLFCCLFPLHGLKAPPLSVSPAWVLGFSCALWPQRATHRGCLTNNFLEYQLLSRPVSGLEQKNECGRDKRNNGRLPALGVSRRDVQHVLRHNFPVASSGQRESQPHGHPTTPHHVAAAAAAADQNQQQQLRSLSHTL